jgi:hypothetical protein
MPPPADRPADRRPSRGGTARRRRRHPPAPPASRLASMWAMVLNRFRDHLYRSMTAGDDNPHE